MANQTEKKTTLKPLADRVLAKRYEEKETTKGGIILPDSSKKQQEVAEVIAVGPGKKIKNEMIPPPVQEGDKILIDQYGGQKVSIDDEEYIIVKSDEIIAIIQ